MTDTCRWTPPCEGCGVPASQAKPAYSITQHESGRLLCGSCSQVAERFPENAPRLPDYAVFAQIEQFAAEADHPGSTPERARDLELLIGECMRAEILSWSWTRGRGKPGIGKHMVEAWHNPYGWRKAHNQAHGWQPCGQIVNAQVRCRKTATWRVETRKNRHHYTGHYCTEHLPAEDHPYPAWIPEVGGVYILRRIILGATH